MTSALNATVTHPRVPRKNPLKQVMAKYRKLQYREAHESPVITTYPDGTTLVETPEQFRARRGLKQCTRCWLWVPAAELDTVNDVELTKGKKRSLHQCKWAPLNPVHGSDAFQSGVDAWFGDRPAGRRRDDDLVDAVEA